MVSSNNGINNTVGASISGVTNTLTVTNPSNTASSAARTTITVGGATAEDPTLNFNVNGATDWEMGIANSDSDKLKISQASSLGTNDSWVMTIAGERRLPRQPSFIARLSSTASNVTGDGTEYTIICDQVDINVGSHYDNTTGVFTAPIDGTYWFSGGVTYDQVTSSHTRSFFVLASSGAGIMTSSRWGQGNLGNMRDSLDAAHFSGAAIMNLTAGDQITIKTQVYNGTKTIDILPGGAGEGLTYFEGCLLL